MIAGYSGERAKAVAGLDDPDPEVRCAALGALARLGVLERAAVEQALRDPEPSVRSRAARLAARTGTYADVLVGLLDDPEDMVVEVAAFALGECTAVPPPTIAALSEVATNHSDSLCRESAVAALGSLGDDAGLPAVLLACRDKATVRRRAVLALASFDGTEVTEMLGKLTNDRDLQVRQAAQELLAIEEGESL